jgi:tetratricopeptide (TPR) repeat protein
MPPLADGFSSRPETAPDLNTALVPGAAVVLAPGRTAGEGSPDWPASCGKTQLAVYFAESLWRSRMVDLLVWVVATSRASVVSGFAEAAAATGSDDAGTAESAADHFMGWLSQTSRPWMVVLDDLRNAADLDGLWPEGPAGRVLITTANSATVSGRKALTLPVREFSMREALSYLMGRLTADPDQRVGAIDLVGDLGCEPPALFQASAVISCSGLSCRDYRDYFAQRRAQLAEMADEGQAAAVTWTLSVEQAERLSPGGGAQYLLALAALLDGHGIPGAVVTTPAVSEYLAAGTGTAMDPNRAWGALLSLERAGLLVIDPATTPPTVRMAEVVQAAIRTATPKRIAERAARAAADALVEVWPEPEPEPWLAAGLRSCAESLRQEAGDVLWETGSCHPLLPRAGRSLDDARLTGPAVSYWRELAATSDRILGPGSPDTLMAGSHLAAALMAAGQAAEAVAWSQWVLAGRTRLLGPDSPGTIAARADLGRAFLASGQAGAAIPVLEEAVSECERVRGVDHLDTLSARDELAAACRSAGKPDDAIRLYRRTLADRERIQGQRHPDTMTTREQLADAYRAEGRSKDAISQFKRVLADRERVLGADHLDTIAARANLASAYHSAGKMSVGLQLHEQACQGYERVLGPDHPETLARRADLANTFYAVGRLTDATTMLRDTVERCERALPPGDPLTRSLRESLANIAGE